MILHILIQCQDSVEAAHPAEASDSMCSVLLVQQLALWACMSCKHFLSATFPAAIDIHILNHHKIAWLGCRRNSILPRGLHKACAYRRVWTRTPPNSGCHYVKPCRLLRASTGGRTSCIAAETKASSADEELHSIKTIAGCKEATHATGGMSNSRTANHDIVSLYRFGHPCLPFHTLPL